MGLIPVEVVYLGNIPALAELVGAVNIPLLEHGNHKWLVGILGLEVSHYSDSDPGYHMELAEVPNWEAGILNWHPGIPIGYPGIPIGSGSAAGLDDLTGNRSEGSEQYTMSQETVA
ncbi:hypothetical protein C8J57DRAFT_1252509 [Mycena rebaudengoi]|nr:hypothetical protein C8J57DRAFT_1252509 [Mycena rebaudengoi]